VLKFGKQATSWGRSMGNVGEDVLSFVGYTLDPNRGCVRNTNEEIELRPKSFELLSYLVTNAGRLISKDELVNAVWPNVIVSDDSLAQCVSDVRHALNDPDRSIIKTVPRRGYLFAAPVSVRSQGNSPTVSAQAPAAANPQIPPAVAAPAPPLSIVVLPFANLSSDPDQEYFVDGITDDLTTDLSRISDSFVIARHTAFTYKGKPVDVKQIGRELGVRYVLEGSVRRIDDQVRVTVQLIDAQTGAHVWADRFDFDRTNLAEAQDAITGRLARTLYCELVADIGRRIEQERSVDPDARDFVMRGWAWFYRPRSVAGLQEAQRLFEQAYEIDPGSVDAKIGIARILVSRVANSLSASYEQDAARAEQLLLQALERDTNSSVAHFSMGMLRRTQNRLSEARIELERAIALDRNDASAFLQLGLVLVYLGRPEAAIPHAEKAIRLSPLGPNTHVNDCLLGRCHLLLGRADEAIDLLTKARAANPRLWYHHLLLAGALGLRGDLDEAKAAIAEAIKLKPEANSLARLRAHPVGNPQYRALVEKTLAVGLRRAGMPEE
jgi:adenylate cyclase